MRFEVPLVIGDIAIVDFDIPQHNFTVYIISQHEYCRKARFLRAATQLTKTK